MTFKTIEERWGVAPHEDWFPVWLAHEEGYTPSNNPGEIDEYSQPPCNHRYEDVDASGDGMVCSLCGMHKPLLEMLDENIIQAHTRHELFFEADDGFKSMYPELGIAQAGQYLKRENEELRQTLNKRTDERNLSWDRAIALKQQIDALESDLGAWKAEALERGETIRRLEETNAQQQKMLKDILGAIGDGNIYTVPQQLTPPEQVGKADAQWSAILSQGFKLACAPNYTADLTQRTLTFVRNAVKAQPTPERQSTALTVLPDVEGLTPEQEISYRGNQEIAAHMFNRLNTISGIDVNLKGRNSA